VASAGAYVAWHAGHLGGRALVLAEAFAGGALFSAGLLHLLADAIEELEKLGDPNRSQAHLA